LGNPKDDPKDDAQFFHRFLYDDRKESGRWSVGSSGKGWNEARHFKKG
jgi:hypothetical protein